jgi:hypothetical protein
LLLLLLLLLLVVMMETSTAVLVLTMFVVVCMMSGHVKPTILLWQLLAVTLNRCLLIFAHSSDREIQGLFLMW